MVVNEPSNIHIPPAFLKGQELQRPIQDLGVIKINYKRSNLKRHIELAQIEKDSSYKKDTFDLNTSGNNKYASFLSVVSPEYKINRNFLSLTKVSVNRRKQSFMFVFFMNKDKVNSNKDTSHTRMHVLGPKRIMPEQRVIDDQYPVDVSVAKYDDGYASREWNLVLPNKKPREVTVSLMWSF